MAEALKVAGVLAGAGALVTSGVVIGRKTAPKVQGCALPEAPPRWPADIVTLQYLWLDIHRQGPGRYLVRDGDARWTLPRSFAAARIDLGGKTLEQDEWRVLTGALEAAWSVLDVVPREREVHGVHLLIRELPPEHPASIVIRSPVEILRRGGGRFSVHAPHRTPIELDHLPPGPQGTIELHDVDLTRWQWMLYTAILEAAWLVAETLHGFLDGEARG